MAYMTQQVAHYKRALRYEFVEAIARTLAGKIIRREFVDRERVAAHARHR
jgi:acyl-CoA synthetase (AMP-forming)/AMP-acid ligase II